MFARERKEAILIYMRQHKKASIRELSEEFQVTGATIRTDLRELEAEGLLIRTHGGAVLNQGPVEKENRLALRKGIYHDEKRRIARKAREFVQDGDILFIDSGTTMLAFSRELSAFEQLKVVTNDLTIALELQNNPKMDILLAGGNVRNEFECTIGSFAIDFLNQLSVDKVFMCPNALSLSKGLTTPFEGTSFMKQAMMRMSEERYLLCDSSKIGKTAFCKFADLDEFSYLITDDGVKQEDIENLEQHGLHTIVCKKEH